MTVRVLVVIVMRVLMAIVFMLSGVWMGVAQRAVTVQIAFDTFIGGGGHGPSG
jgi:hypothetical protein